MARRRSVPSTWLTHAPLALTSARAVTCRAVACALLAQLHLPDPAAVACRNHPRARQHGGAALRGVQRIEHHQPAVLDPAIRILEASLHRWQQRRTQRRAGKCQRLRSPPAARGRRRGRRRTGPGAAASVAAVHPHRAARSAVDARCAARWPAVVRVRPGTRAPAAARRIPGSAGRRGSAWSWPRRCARRGHPARPGRREDRGRPRRARCRRR